MKWRHLVNCLPLDNATLKLRHNGVGRRLAHRQDKTSRIEVKLDLWLFFYIQDGSQPPS